MNGAPTNASAQSVMTDIPARRPGSVWSRHTAYLGPPAWARHMRRRLRRPRLSAIAGRIESGLWGWRLWRARWCFPVAVTTGAGPGIVFALLQGLPGARRIPHVMIDCLWYRERNPLRRAANRLKLRLAARSVERFIVWSRCEVEDYAAEFGIPAAKFQFVPHHASLEGYRFQVRDDGGVFAGGDGDRDYAALIEAVRGLEAPVIIATRRAEWHHRRGLPPNVQVIATDPAGFRRAMAAASIVVVPMARGLLHHGGQQTYLNAMAMGKPVIVCDEAARDYIEDGVTGLVVPAGCAAHLRAALVRLLGDPDFARALGRRAARAVKQRGLETDACMERVLAAARAARCSIACGKRGTHLRLARHLSRAEGSGEWT